MARDRRRRRFLFGRLKVLFEIVLGRLRLRSDFVGYKTLLDYIETSNLWNLPGDVLEIGAFMGGGTAKLARAALKHRKRVLVVDSFDPTADTTINARGERMAWIYQSILGPRALRPIFDHTIREFSNVLLYPYDSRKVHFENDQELLFAFIDGNHASTVVAGDFRLAWSHTVAGGVVAFHDYGGDLPSVTAAIDVLRRSLRHEIAAEHRIPAKRLIFLHKKGMEERSGGPTRNR